MSIKGKGGNALGMLEVCGYGVALLVISEMYLHADIQVADVSINKPAVAVLEKIPIQVQIKFKGTVDQVKAASDLGYEVALKHNAKEDIIRSVIANPHGGLAPLISNL